MHMQKDTPVWSVLKGDLAASQIGLYHVVGDGAREVVPEHSPELAPGLTLFSCHSHLHRQESWHQPHPKELADYIEQQAPA